MQIVTAGVLDHMKVRFTKTVIGKMNRNACLILKQNLITQRSYLIMLFLIIGYCAKMALGFLNVQPTVSNANKYASKMKPWFSHIALVQDLQLWNASCGNQEMDGSYSKRDYSFCLLF